MSNSPPSGPASPHFRKLTIVAQDPSIKVAGKILTADVAVPTEELLPGPCGYRVNVIDYDASTNTLYEPATVPSLNGKRPAVPNDRRLLDDPRFHAQNVYAIVMRTLARFEFALGRRVAWGCDGHQLHIAPHAFAEANAFYSREDRGLFFGYFTGHDGSPVFTCLAHDVVAHETTHAILDGLRSRYLEPSSPDQAAFHEGFADVIALLSVFSLADVVAAVLDRQTVGQKLIAEKFLSRKSLKESVLLGLAKQMGSELSSVRGEALRRSVELKPGLQYSKDPDFQEEHARGELIVAAIMNAFLDIWLARLAKVGFIERRKRDRNLVVEEGAKVAEHLLTMAIRAIDYCPPTDLSFSDYLSALLTVDREVVPDDEKYGYRDAILRNFKAFDIRPDADKDGTWPRFGKPLTYARTHFDSMLRDKEEVFRFIWENRVALELDGGAYIEVESVRPCTRIGPDGFVLRETVAEYVQIMTLKAEELRGALDIDPPPEIPGWRRLRIYGGGALIFDEYGQLKYQIANHIARTDADRKRQAARLRHLSDSGYFDRAAAGVSRFAQIHLRRATR